MQIRLVAGSAAREVDLTLDDPDACVADLVRAAAPEAPPGVGLSVDGRWFGPDLGLDEAGLYEGAAAHLSSGPVPPPALAEGPALVVIAGPDAGRTIPLRSGTATIGRDASCEVALDDPSLSACHAELLVARSTDGGPLLLEIRDLGSRNGTWVEGTAISEPTWLEPGAMVRLGATVLRPVAALPDDRTPGAEWLHAGSSGLVPFNRPPRPAPPGPPEPVEVPEPPKEEGRSVTFSIISVIAPLLMGGALVYFTGRWYFAIFMLLSPVMAIGNYVTGKRRAKKERRAGSKAHAEALAVLAEDLAAAAAAERERLEAVLPDLPEVVRRTERRSTQLWQRRPDHPDWLSLRAGTGELPWEPPLEHAGPKAKPDDAAREVIERHATLSGAPVAIELAAGGVVGLVGDRAAALALARSLICQAAVHHGPADLGMAVVVGEGGAEAWDWVKWLPHVRDDDGTTRLLATGREDAGALLGALLEAGSAEEQQPGRWRAAGDATVRGRTRLLVLDDIALTEGRRAPARLLLSGRGGPVAGIVLADSADQLPAVVSTIVELGSDLGDAEVRRPQEGVAIPGVVTAGLREDLAREAARNLARWEDPEFELVGAGLPGMVRLLPLLGLDELEPALLADRWAQGRREPALRAPVGVGEEGVLWLDLVRDGPHGLVGGTTGSGKSELLRSVVAGLAAGADPDHLVFVLVDYKGGSAFAECAGLPHTVGMVTDLDGHLGERALASLEAELHHRERVLRDADVSDLPEYLRAGAPLGPLPRLVVVIDEFATLATELPDFLGALVGIAQRGRSLGVHLILATQRPSGAVNANIKANTNLRIALRVQDAADSTDVIDTPEAATIRREQPGRAYVRLGPGEVVAVQTPLSTAAAPTGQRTGVRLAPFTFGFLPSAPAPVEAGSDGATDLTRLVAAARDAFAASGAAPPRRPWLEMLPDEVALADVLADGGVGAGAWAGADPSLVPFALADEPAHQRRAATGWRPDEGHLAIFGMVGSGTTTAVVAAGAAVAAAHHPDDCHLYALDFGGGGLAPLAALPHTGAVIGATDSESQLRLIRLLRRELDRRRDLDPAARATEPRIVVLIDGIGAFLAEHDAVDAMETAEAFRRVFSEGAGVGISCIVAGDRPGEIPMRLGSLISQRLILRLADPSEFSLVGVRPKDLPAFVPGRAIDDAGRVVQVGLPPADLGELVGDVEVRRPPTRVGSLPATLPLDALPGASLGPGPIRIPIGLSDEDLAVVELVLHPGDHAVVAGQPRSGVTSTLTAIAAALRAADPALVLIGVCEPRSALYDAAALDAAGTVAELGHVLRAGVADERRWVVLVDDAGRVEDVDGVLADLLRSGRADLHVVAGGRADDLRGGYGHWSRATRASRTGILLQPNLATDGEVLALRLPRRLPVALVAGRGFVVNGGEPVLAQVALPPAGEPALR